MALASVCHDFSSRMRRQCACKQEKKAAKLANKGKGKGSKAIAAAAQSCDIPATADIGEDTTASSSSHNAQSTIEAAAEADSLPSAVNQSSTASAEVSDVSAEVSDVSVEVSNASAAASTPELQGEDAQQAQHISYGQDLATEPSLPGGSETGMGQPSIEQLDEPAGFAEPAAPAASAGSALPAEPAEPRDHLTEMEALGKLPDMPKTDYSDDLPGLFQAAFATCESQLSPRKAARQLPKPIGLEELSLYDDADEALAEGNEEGLGLDGVVRDASDDEENQKVGGASGHLLESIINKYATTDSKA